MQVDKDIELGKLYFERGDVLKAIEILEPARERYLKLADYKLYLEAVHILFRSYSETFDITNAKKRQDELVSLSEDSELTLDSKTYYILALYSSYFRDYESSLKHSQQALKLGLEANAKEDTCHAILGISIAYYFFERYDEALKEIYNLQVFMNVLDLPHVSITANVIKGHILRKIGKYDQAIEVLWQSYEYLKVNKNFYYYLTILYGLGLTYRDSGKYKEAYNYVKLAKCSIDPKNLCRLSNAVDDLLASLSGNSESDYDLVFSKRNNTVLERHKGKVDFKNQFILIDLLKLFLTYPGKTFCKETLVKLIWKQSYNPAVHDNKIYVTIKRLRQLIEPDTEKPKYIFRSKNGYYLDKDARVHIDEMISGGN